MFVRTVAMLLVLLLVTPAAASPSRPRLLLTPDSVVEIRTRAQDKSKTALGYVPWDAWLKLEAAADRFVAAPAYHYAVNIPNRTGKGSSLWEYTLSDAPPPRHDDSKHYPPWTAMFQERADSITARLKHLCFAYVVSRDAKYANRAKQIVMHLIAWPGVWTDPSYSSGVPCLDTGHAATWVSIFYDWCYDTLTEEERVTVRTALVEKAVAPIDSLIDKISPYHNYTAVIATGLCMGGTALLGEDDRAQSWIDHAVSRMKLNLDAQGKDGGPMEGPMYGTYAANNFTDMIWALHSAGIPNDLTQHRYIQSLPRYCASMLSLNSRGLPTFGDGGMGPAFVNLMLILSLNGDTDAAWYCRQIHALEPGSVRSFLALDPNRITPKRPAFNPSTAFVDVGYAVLRDGYDTDAPYLAFKCGPPVARIGHNHLDHNSFVISYAGSWPAWDPGYRSYFSPQARKYTVSTFGHNSVVLDLDDEFLKTAKYAVIGRTQRHLNKGRIAEFFTSSAFDYVMGRAAEPYNDKGVTVLNRFDRQIVYAKPDMFFIRDTLDAPEPHTFSFMLHARAGDLFDLSEGQARTMSANCYLQTAIYSPRRLTLTTGTYPGAEQYGPYLAATTQETRNTHFTAVLVPRRHAGLIVNGGFEAGKLGWRPRNMAGWEKNHTIDTNVKHRGKASACIDAPGGYYYSRNFRVPVGSKLTARWWAKCTAARGASSIFYYWRGGKSFARALGPIANANEWRQYEFNDTVPEGTEEICLALQFFGKQGRCWYDDAELTTDARDEDSPPAHIEPLGDGADGAVATAGDATHIFLCGAEGQPRTVKTAGRTIETDAELAVVSLDGDAMRVFMLRGSRLVVDGKPMEPVEGIWRIEK